LFLLVGIRVKSAGLRVYALRSSHDGRQKISWSITFYPKITHEVLPILAVFMVCCGCDVKNPGPAMLVYYPKTAREVLPIRAIIIVGCDCDVKKSGPAVLVYPAIQLTKSSW